MAEAAMQPFFDAMDEKFLRRATGQCHACGGEGMIHPMPSGLPVGCFKCNGTGKENRSLEPWKDYSLGFLIARLRDEILEFEAHYRGGHPLSKEAADELLDIGNFSGMLWMMWKEI